MITRGMPRLTLLDRLTVGYVVTLVVVLAASLITILWYLWQIGTLLRQIKEALIEVERNTQPLQEALTPVNESLEGVAASLVRARDHLAGSESHLSVGETPLPSPLPVPERGNTTMQERGLGNSPLPVGEGSTLEQRP